VPRVRAGYTLLELVLVLTIAGIMGALVVPAYGDLRDRQHARNARDAFVWLGERARLHAVERGATVVLELDAQAGRAWAVRRGTADTLDVLDFAGSGVTVTGPDAQVRLCYGPRGYATACPAGSAALPADARFRSPRASSTVRIHPLGQMERF
jgi:prepilin-type N-terminal cleavage/methylation domain-containing protein